MTDTKEEKKSTKPPKPRIRLDDWAHSKGAAFFRQTRTLTRGEALDLETGLRAERDLGDLLKQQTAAKARLDELNATIAGHRALIERTARTIDRLERQAKAGERHGVDGAIASAGGNGDPDGDDGIAGGGGGGAGVEVEDGHAGARD